MARPEHIYTAEVSSKDFIEPFSGTLYDRAHGAMPANPFKNEDVKKRQASIERELLKLFLTSPSDQYIPESFQQFFVEDYEIGERRRHMTNFNNYAEWQKTNPSIPGELQPLIERYEEGTAEVGDVIDICLNTTVSSGLEIGRVTHPYWQRMEHVLSLRQDIAQAVEARGGQLEPWITPYRSISIVPYVEQKDGVERVIGFIVPYKHDIATLVRPSDGSILHVVERQVAGIRVDEASGFSQGVVRRMHEVADARDNFSWQNVNDERFEYHLRNTGARGLIEKAIQTDSTAPFLVPESTTVYIHAEKPEVSQALGRVAFRAPDRDAGIAYYDANILQKAKPR